MVDFFDDSGQGKPTKLRRRWSGIGLWLEKMARHQLFTPILTAVVTATLTGLVTWFVTQSQERTKVRVNSKTEAMTDMFASRAGRKEEMVARAAQARIRALLLSENPAVASELSSLGKLGCFAWISTEQQASDQLEKCTPGYVALFNAYRDELGLARLPPETVRNTMAISDFLKGMELLPTQEKAESAAPPPPLPLPVNASFMVFFDFEASDLSGQARQVLGQAAQAYANGFRRVVVKGHTDTADEQPVDRSLQRANVVKDALVEMDLPAEAVTAIGLGATELLVPTPDRVREPQNRRVEIILSRN